MTETDELVARLREGFNMAAQEEAAARLEAQSTALTAAHEALDAQRERIAELEGALEFYADRRFDGYDVNITDYGISMDTGPIIKDAGDIARAALSAES